ncbi:Ribonuclease H superfamily, partial [Fusarium oxysporum f. sp. vasinfectum]
MDPIDLSSSRVNLNGPGDWKQWISIIHKFATAQNVWKYIDPSNAEKPALSKPEEPTVQQIRPTASDLTDLTAEEFRRLEFLHTQYRTKVQTHRDQQKALSSIQQHIVKTIGNYYSTIADEHDIAKELALLKARVQPTDWAHEQEVLERYYAVLKAPNRSKIDTWITSWQRILTEAQKLDLPDIKNLRPTRQFLQAVSSINPAFTDYWINKMEDEARNKPNWQDSFPDGIKISEIFERSHKAKRATGSKAVFSTFQNEGPNQSNNGYNDGDKGSNRRSKPSCLCGKKHYYSECYYLSKAARPNGWKPNKDIEHKINQKLEDPVLKEKVNRSLERYAGQRPQEPQAVQDHQNSADVRGTAQLSILGYGQVHLRLEEGGIFILNEVAHIPAFHTNVASLDRMINKGYNWNPQTGAVTAKGKIVFHTKRINRQPVIEFNPVRPQQAPSAFSSSSEPRPEQVQEATRWHQRLGHLNPEALEQLVRHTTGARIKGPIRIDCRPCSEAKATRIISRRGPHAKAPRPFWRIYIDVFHLHESYNGKKTALLIKDEFTGMIFAYFHTEATQAALLGSLKSFESMIQRQYALGLCRIHRDNDPSLRTASQPDVTHLKAYGCRAYPMTGKALRNTQKKDLKTEAHAETGYLVGYDSSNIFRIWIPERSEVRRVRDVTFNEKVFFDPKDHPNNPNSSDTDEEIDQIRSADETLPEIIVNTQGLQLTSSSDHTSQEPDEEPDQGHDAYDAYPSPQLTTSSAPPEPANQQLRSQRQRRPARKLLENEAQKKAGFHIYTRSFFQGREEKLHRRSLPPEPRNWKELQGHRFEPEFKEAANMEMGSHWSRGTFKPFDLETRQLDAVNAFTNSLIDEDIYVLFPDGYSRRGWILKLIRALYGLRRSPLLWQKDLSNTFKQLGLELCPEDPCVFNNTWLTAFFF